MVLNRQAIHHETSIGIIFKFKIQLEFKWTFLHLHLFARYTFPTAFIYFVSDFKKHFQLKKYKKLPFHSYIRLEHIRCLLEQSTYAHNAMSIEFVDLAARRQRGRWEKTASRTHFLLYSDGRYWGCRHAPVWSRYKYWKYWAWWGRRWTKSIYNLDEKRANDEVNWKRKWENFDIDISSTHDNNNHIQSKLKC